MSFGRLYTHCQVLSVTVRDDGSNSHGAQSRLSGFPATFSSSSAETPKTVCLVSDEREAPS